MAEVAAGHLAATQIDLLTIELDAIEASRRSGWFTVGVRRRRSEVETARYAWALAQEYADNGIIRTAITQMIADKLGVGDPYARRMVKLGREMSRTPENAPRKPSVHAESFATNAESDVALPPAAVEAERGASA